MTPHEKALEAAEYVNDQFGLSDAIKTYLITLLDSPEMTQKLSETICRVGHFDMMLPAVIAAIKKEAGCE